jgi:beta-glucosidase
LNAAYAAKFVSGLQGSDPTYVRIAATPKHFIGYSGPENNPSRLGFDAIITQQDLADSYLPAFQSAVQQGNASGIMYGWFSNTL